MRRGAGAPRPRAQPRSAAPRTSSRAWAFCPKLHPGRTICAPLRGWQAEQRRGCDGRTGTLAARWRSHGPECHQAAEVVLCGACSADALGMGEGSEVAVGHPDACRASPQGRCPEASARLVWEEELKPAGMNAGDLGSGVTAGEGLLRVALPRCVLRQGHPIVGGLMAMRLQILWALMAALGVSAGWAQQAGTEVTAEAVRQALAEGKSLAGASFGPLDLAGVRAGAVDLSGTRWRGTDWRGAVFEGTHLTGAQLEDVIARGATFIGADLSGLTALRTDLAGARVQDCLIAGVQLQECNLAGADFSGCRYSLSGARYLDALARALTAATGQTVSPAVACELVPGGVEQQQKEAQEHRGSR